ncbi:MAG: hypothetical protein JSW07_16605 [bacterium]|nr:MAG: hypothetical protein JSW07_16605 [bacterium]
MSRKKSVTPQLLDRKKPGFSEKPGSIILHAGIKKYSSHEKIELKKISQTFWKILSPVW